MISHLFEKNPLSAERFSIDGEKAKNCRKLHAVYQFKFTAVILRPPIAVARETVSNL